MKVRVEALRKLELYEPTTELDKADSELIVVSNKVEYQYGKYKSRSYDRSYFNHFSLLVDPDGSPWADANRYLLSRLGGVVPAKHRTLESIASDLSYFRQWLLTEGVDYLYVTERPRARPTYRYCSYLHDEVEFQKFKASTAKRRMSCVQNFYRWLVDDGHDFKYPLWFESDAKFFFINSRGFRQTKAFKSSDLTRSFKTTKNTNDYSEYIEDGGKLRPLPKDEQIALVESLRKVGNTEMLLSFFFALTTGARMQTVFTLRQKHFSQSLPDGSTYYRLKVGGGTLINTKNSKQMVLLLPAWLYQRIRIYLHSNRYKNRVTRSSNTYKNKDEQYVFLTRVGQPYYMADQDEFSYLYRSPPRGNAVTQFMRQQLKPNLADNDHFFEFRFHDLRATFGMNLLEGKLQNYQLGGVAIANQPDFFQILMYVRERMGHSHVSTTEAYLNYRQKYHLALHMQSEYEQFLERIIQSVEDSNDLG